MGMTYPWQRQEVQMVQQRRALPVVKLVPYPCIVLLPGGKICGKPAGVLDKSRGGLICWSCFHGLEISAEERLLRYTVPFEDAPWSVEERKPGEDI